MALPRDPLKYLKEHYAYELDMLRSTYAALQTQQDWLSTNVLIESFCIHARALVDFFRSTSRRSDDVLATDFIGSGQFAAVATAGLAPEICDRVNKQIAHLTLGRENPVKKVDPADRYALLTAIEADHIAFKNAVDDQYARGFDAVDGR